MRVAVRFIESIGWAVLLAIVVTVSNAATTETASYAVYRGSSIAERSTSLDACKARAAELEEIHGSAATYVCNVRYTYVRTSVTPPPPVCTTPQPASETRSQSCPTGTTGQWSQTRTYASAPYPTCWTAGDWTPTSAPAGACVTPPPVTPPVSGNRTVGDEWFVETNTPPLFGWTNYGGDSSTTGREIVVTTQSSGGPQGRPFIRQTINDSKYEFGYGWNFERLPANPSKVFVRFSWRQNTDNQLQKLLMVNPGGTNRGRSILQNYGWDGGMAMRVAIDGGLQCQTTGQPSGQWQNYQLEISYRGSWTGYKLWRDSNDYARPTCQWQGAVTPLTSGNWVSFSGYHQGNVGGGGTRIVDHADVRIGPTFDAGWHR